MNIMILTQPLVNNYGGLLQNYALQSILKKMNHNVITYNYIFLGPPKYVYLKSWLKTLLLALAGKRRCFAKIIKPEKRNYHSNHFLVTSVNLTSIQNFYRRKIIQQYKIDAIIIGSDQVWRPRYNYRIQDMFLKFAETLPIKRIAYAASFGVDNWEYSHKLTKVCSALAKKFDAISVREDSGVNLCKEHLGIDATWVLDPTLLLKKEDYCEVCKDVPIAGEKFLAAYVLDKNETILAQCESIAAERGLNLKIFEAETNATLSVPEWLAMFRDASYVVTNSFHGTVFSIIFGKKFKCLYNKTRGSARFDSLLKLYESGKLDEMRKFSFNWLKNALEN